MNIENSSPQSNENLNLAELPENIKEIAIADLEESLSEEYKEPSTNLEKIQDLLYQKERQNESTEHELELISNKDYLYYTLVYENYSYPPGNTPIDRLKTFIRNTTNFSMERRCWELLKQHHELAELKGCQTLIKEVDYENFVQQYCNDFEDFEYYGIPTKVFSRLFSKTIINLTKDEDTGEMLDRYTQGGDLLHPEGIEREQVPSGFTPTQEELKYLFKKRIKKNAREILPDLNLV